MNSNEIPRWYRWNDFPEKLAYAQHLFAWFTLSSQSGKRLEIVLQQSRFYAYGVAEYGPDELRCKALQLLMDIEREYNKLH